MSKIIITHEIEQALAIYCATNNIELTLGNAYDIVMEVFKNVPIKTNQYNENTGENETIDITGKVARNLECQEKTICRINEKAQITKDKINQTKIKNNIKQAEIDSNPNLLTLVENLNRLNIVDKTSYLSLVCFLMQLKYTRNHEMAENDKTCVFFNGVARNGKSATAKAIVDIESDYGKVYRGTSGKILESTHEEEVWKSHLNYFDEVKPTDIDRELLLTIINGGDVEINPKNKKQYTYHVNTNNIFTSNDTINNQQRRVSVIKFGERLNGRPLEQNTMKKIITNIMNSLPSFDHYYDIYKMVSIENENRMNPVAIEAIKTYLSEEFREPKGYHGPYQNWHEDKLFTASDIYSCIKDKYKKQLVTSEKKQAIRNTLKEWAMKGIIKVDNYMSSSTTFYEIKYETYLKIADTYDKMNSKEENIQKAKKFELYDLFEEYYKDKNEENEKPYYIENEVVDLKDERSINEEIYDNIIKLKEENKIDNCANVFETCKFTIKTIKNSLRFIGKYFQVKNVMNKCLEKDIIYDVIPCDLMLAIFKNNEYTITPEDENYLKEKYENRNNPKNSEELIDEDLENLSNVKEINLSSKPEDKVIATSEVEVYENQLNLYYDLLTYLNEIVHKNNGIEHVNIKEIISADEFVRKMYKKLHYENIVLAFEQVFEDKFKKSLRNKLLAKYSKITCFDKPQFSRDVINKVHAYFSDVPF